MSWEGETRLPTPSQPRKRNPSVLSGPMEHKLGVSSTTTCLFPNIHHLLYFFLSTLWKVDGNKHPVPFLATHFFFPLDFYGLQNPYKKSKGWWGNIKNTKQKQKSHLSLLGLIFLFPTHPFLWSNVILLCIIYSFSLLLLPIILFLSPSINLSCTLLMRGTGRVKLLNLH